MRLEPLQVDSTWEHERVVDASQQSSFCSRVYFTINFYYLLKMLRDRSSEQRQPKRAICVQAIRF